MCLTRVAMISTLSRAVLLTVCVLGLARTALAVTGGEVTPAGSWEGVGQQTTTILGNTFVSSGTLIDSTHILTAAHTLYDSAGNMVTPANFQFKLPENATTYTATSFTVEPGYNPAVGVVGGFDIAVVKLSAPVTTPTTWGYNTGYAGMGNITDETSLGLVAHVVGFGLTEGANAVGTGTMAGTTGTKHDFTNQVDRIGNGVKSWTDGTAQAYAITPPRDTQVFDFDKTPGTNASNLTNVHDPMGANGTLTSLEGDTAPGDSGGPLFEFDFALGKFIITGITSYGSDVGPGPNFPIGGSRYGDVSVETQVLPYVSFINAAVPEPSSFVLLAGGGVFLLVAGQRARRRRR